MELILQAQKAQTRELWGKHGEEVSLSPQAQATDLSPLLQPHPFSGQQNLHRI